VIGVLFRFDGEMHYVRCLILPRKVLYQKRLGYPKLKTVGMFLLTIAQRITQQNTSLVFRPMLKNIKVLS
jgi:hypothetical protein